MSKQLSKVTQNKLEKLLANTGDMALKRRARGIIQAIDPQNGDRILDLGCGDGYYLHLLKNLNLKLKLYGSDFDKPALERAKNNLKSKDIVFKFGDLMKKLPFKDNFFDKIIMSEVAEHLPNDVTGFKEVRRVLKKGGIVVITVPNKHYPFLWDPLNWVLEHLFGTHIESGFFAGLWNQHERLYSTKGLKLKVEKSGLKVQKLLSTTWWCLPFNHYIVNIVARLLFAKKLSPEVHSSLNKFSKVSNKPKLIDLSFKLVNTFDKLNDFYTPKNSGVGVFLVAKK